MVRRNRPEHVGASRWPQVGAAAAAGDAVDAFGPGAVQYALPQLLDVAAELRAGRRPCGGPAQAATDAALQDAQLRQPDAGGPLPLCLPALVASGGAARGALEADAPLPSTLHYFI
jgi:hypothetical protein